MQRLRDLPIALKLGAGFGAIIALMVVIALFGLSRLGASNGHTEYVTTKSLPSIELIAGVDTEAAVYHGTLFEHIVAQTDGQMSDLEAELRGHAGEIQKSFNGYQASVSDARDKALYDQAQSQWQSFLAQSANVVKASRDNRSADAAAAVAKADASYDGLDATIVKWLDYNKHLANQRHEESVATYKSSRTLTFGLLALAIALGAGIAFAITRQIKRVVSVVLDRLGMLRDHCAADLRGALQAMAEGDLTRTVTPVTPLIDDPAKDELGQVAASVNAIRNSTVASVEAYNATRER